MTCYSWKDLPLETATPFKSRRVFKGEKIKVILLTLRLGHIGERHRHQSEQISHILKGKVKVKLNRKERMVQTGDFIHIPKNQPHQIEAMEDETIILEIFSPAEYQKVICK